MNDLKILYHGDARLADWGETRAGGKYIKLFLDDTDEDPLLKFRGLDIGTLKKSGHNFNLTISSGDILPPTEPILKPYGKIANSLYTSGFFIAPAVLSALGTDAQYRHWIQREPSAFSGLYSEYIDGEGRCIAAHVRRSGEAGTGFKPPYSCIPLTDQEHTKQHQHGESALISMDWEKEKNKYLVMWGKKQLCDMFDVESTGQIVPIDLRHWCEKFDLYQYLPRAYREA